MIDDQRRVVGIVSEADLPIKQAYPHGDSDAGMLEALRHPRRFGKGAVAWEIRHSVLNDRFGERAAGVEVEVHDGMVALTGRLKRRSQVNALVREVQAVEGAAGVNAQLTWEIDDVVAISTWSIAEPPRG